MFGLNIAGTILVAEYSTSSSNSLKHLARLKKKREMKEKLGARVRSGAERVALIQSLPTTKAATKFGIACLRQNAKHHSPTEFEK